MIKILSLFKKKELQQGDWCRCNKKQWETLVDLIPNKSFLTYFDHTTGLVYYKNGILLHAVLNECKRELSYDVFMKRYLRLSHIQKKEL